MIKEYADMFQEIKPRLLDKFKLIEPSSYEDIFKQTLEMMFGGYGEPDANRIHVIDDGDYQGTLLFVVAAEGYQPYRYWSVKVDYGSCSGCDTFEACATYGQDLEKSAPEMVTMAMHMIQEMKEI